MLGADWTGDRWSAGALIAHSYARRALTDRITVWGVAGYGEGALTLTPQGRDTIETAIDLERTELNIDGVAVGSLIGQGFSPVAAEPPA